MHGIARTIRSLLSNAPGLSETTVFARFCQDIALVYLKKKSYEGRLNISLFGLSYSDLAFDCIADLFRRDASGHFCEIRSYYASLVQTLTEVELIAATRRLVFSKVNNHLYALLREADPSLGRILRNIKNSVKKYPRLFIDEQNGEKWICLDDSADSSETIPMMPEEFLATRLTAAVGGDATIPHTLRCFAEILKEERMYRKAYPLVGLALIIRSAYAKIGKNSESADSNEHPFSQEELKSILATTVIETKRDLSDWYLGRGRIESSTYDCYFRVVDDILTSHYVCENSVTQTYFEHFKPFFPEVKETVYRSEHRKFLEYFVRLTRARFLEQLRKHVGLSAGTKK